MTVLVTEKCGNCGKVLTGWTPDYRGLGIPFVKCEGCGAINNRSSKINEWEAKDVAEKIGYVIVVFWTSLMVSIIPLLGLGFLAISLFPELGEKNLTFGGLISAWVVAWLPGGIFFFVRLKKNIEESNRRMQNEEYRKILAEAGILRIR